MPDQPAKKQRSLQRFTLSKAHADGRLVRARCGSCNIKRVYRCDEMIAVAGDVDVDDLRPQLRCEKCRNKHWIDVEFWSPTARERQAVRLRRLVRVFWRRQVVWRDE